MSNKTTNYNLTKPTADDFYDVDVPNGNMDIIDAELKKLEDKKAPSGHGLGKDAFSIREVSFTDLIRNGCGFYQVAFSGDAPENMTSWLSLLQTVRSTSEGSETAAQLVFRDFDNTKPQCWIRTVSVGRPTEWVEMIHTGNAVSLLPFAKIANGSYVGTGSKTITLTFDFQPKILFFNGCFAIPYGTTLAYVDRSNITVGIKITWNGNSVTIGDGGSDFGFPWHQKDTTYYYAAIG